ncbi:MAG: ribosome-associated translation inhibitor RaiA [Patescibacteria group bacterium]
MKIVQSSRNLEMTQAIEQYIDEKFGSLEKYFKNIIECRVEIDKNTHHRKGNVFTVTVNIDIPNNLIRVEKVGEDLYAVIDLVKDDAERQLRRTKEKYQTKGREAQKTRRSLKSIFFWRKAE